MNKIALYLMNNKGFEILEALIKKGYRSKINFIVSSEDKAVANDYYEEIICLCSKWNLDCYNRKEELPIHAGYALAIGWRWIIRQQKNLIVIHDSLLPKYRGFAPSVNALINGEKEIGATMLLASEEYDKGDILFQERLSITYPIKIKKVIELMSKIYINLTLAFIDKISKNETIKPRPQKHDFASYSLWRDEEDYIIDWNWSAEKIKRFVDAVGYPYKGAKTQSKNDIITIEDVEVLPEIEIENRTPGKIIFINESNPVIVCGKGLIMIISAKNVDGRLYKFKNFRIRLY